LRTKDGLWRSLVSALDWGSRGRRFKSGQPDSISQVSGLSSVVRTGAGGTCQRFVNATERGSGVDFDWMLGEAERLEGLVTRCNAIAKLDSSYYFMNPEYLDAEGQLEGQLLIGAKIAEALGERAIEDELSGRGNTVASLAKAHLVGPAAQLVTAVKRGEEIKEKLGPTGPNFRAKEMHRWVWNAAADLWDDGHLRAAVQQAAAALLDGHLPSKLGVEKSAKAAAPSSAFSPKDPTPATPRLRLDQFTPGSDDWTNAHEGALYLGMACQKLIRNLTSHSADDVEKSEALEQLAALSLFAHLIDEAVLITGP
jgi:hypothetical protein